MLSTSVFVTGMVTVFLLCLYRVFRNNGPSDNEHTQDRVSNDGRFDYPNNPSQSRSPSHESSDFCAENRLLVSQFESVLHNLSQSQQYLYRSNKGRQKFLSAFRTELAELENIKRRLSSLNFSSNDNTQTQLEIADQSQTENLNTTSLSNTLEELTPVLSALAKEKDVNLTYVGSREADVAVSKRFFTRMFQELVINALTHNKTNKSICVQFSHDNAFLHMCISDFGQGMKAETVNSIFEKSINRYPKGRRMTDILSHMDLPIIISIVRKIGGNVDIVSALQLGTQIRVSIPLSHYLEKHQPFETSQPSAIDPYSDILFYGSQTSFENDLIDFLQRRYRVSRLPSPEQLISVIANKTPKIVICNGYTSSCDLLGLMKTLNYLQGAVNTNVLCITEPLSNEQRCHLFEYEVKQVVELPVTLPAIELVVENMLREYKRTEFRVAEAIADYTLAQIDDDNEDSVIDGFECKFAQCLEKNFADPAFSQEDCAKQLFMSTRNLHRKIDSHLNSSFRESLKRYRVEKAKELILNGETVTNAGLNVGFSSPSYFAKCFKSELGYVPSMLSRRLGQS